MPSLEELFWEFCTKNPEGVTDKSFRVVHPNVSPADLAQVINKLVSQGSLELLRSTEVFPDDQVLIVRAHSIARLEGDERIVFQCIKAADNKGIWTKDLKTRSNLHQTVITKVLRTLESRKIIKAVKSVKNSTRKVYMLAHLEPSVEITGGPWFSENELDVEFIEEMCKICYRYIASRSFSERQGHILPADYEGYPDLEDVYRFLMESRVTSAELTVDDVAMLLDRLIFDGLVERVVSMSSRPSRIVADDEDDSCYVYKAVKGSHADSSMGSIPCGTCPVYWQCCDLGPVTPAKCEYFVEWLGF